jgi:acetyl esterase/lipase
MKQAVWFALCAVLITAWPARAQTQAPYIQHQDLVYGEVHGVGLLMDVFVPTGDTNGLAIIDVASGAWHSDRGKIRDHQMARMFDIYCAKGYTVFAIRPGSRTRFTAQDMLENVRTGIRWVKANAEEYGIDPERIGITGASAGGHLASLAAVLPVTGDPDARNPLMRHGTEVAAAGVFFPPTHFLIWGEDGKPDLNRLEDILFPGGLRGRSDEEIEVRAIELSPALRVNGKTPPFLIWHGDADTVVPLQQSEVFVEALREHGGDVTLKVKAGGAHPWMTIPEEVADMANWFDAQLGGK